MERPVLLIAPPYDEETVLRIRRGFAERLGEEPDFEVIEDKKLLGGFVAIIDDRVYDASFSSRLYDIGHTLSE
jgi:F0F1-type ATP synthase delta subunit